ncbi:hypothetical protein EIN_285430 [Entamoeba invadens IP1]|uniref:Uncharacterized protein n=1 Tax=Entamoeba invadens IP1 TaxID=370355 RepID=A0A0A1U4W8_ENTIV|nr:hypothetical protein EIN_285430 [Entamoeba invadens IP1]ELP89317.1 hypothetical protein EIN_285430 [Entamoeba invadens IP1]|eukprot:XP_004256088.1 hypothetical protein EIN_285430 [Entamoeba invadens IP1]
MKVMLSCSGRYYVIVQSQKYFIYNNKQCTYGVYTKNSFTCLNYYSCTNLYYSTTLSKCIECPIEKRVFCLRTGKCIKCETNYLLDSKNNTCTLFHIDNCLISQNGICLKCEEGKLLENGLCVSPKNNCQQFDIDANCLLCDTTWKLINEGILCETVDIKNNSNSQRNITSCVDGYFVKDNKCVSCQDKYNGSYLCDSIQPLQCNTTLNYVLEENKNCEKSSCFLMENTQKDQNGKCLSNQPNCRIIVNNKCVTCDENYILSNSKCLSSVDNYYEIDNSTYGYYRNGLDCQNRLINCFTCNTANSCLTYYSTNYMTGDGLCKPQNE